jgi:hypothetical protein
MRPGKRSALPVLAFVLVIAAWGSYAAAAPPDDTSDRPHSQNMHLLGSSLRAGAVTGPPPAGPGTVPWDTRNTDLAFWGKRAIQGRYDGFRVIDITSPGDPQELVFFECVSPQGDVGVYGNLVFRSVDAQQQTDQCTDVAQNAPSQTGPADCTPVPAPCTGFEGIQIFDISDLDDIQLVKSVPLDCGSHTHTVVPDPAENRVLIYNSVSGNALQPNPGKYGNRCPGPPFNREDIVEVPLDEPASASVVGAFELGEVDGHHIEICHDMGVILGSVNRAACAGHPGVAVFDISDLDDPEFLYAFSEEEEAGVERWHSAAFSWNGKYLVTGWEPGGGTAPRCQPTGTPISPPILGRSTQTDEMKSLFIYDAETGEELGRHVLPRDQSQYENCTIHNYNIVPHPTRNLLVHGSYQSGTALVDFTDPSNAYEVAWMDPLPLDPPTATSPGGRTAFRGGDWSSYWYNGLIYESDTRRGLYVWNVSAPEVRGPTVRLDHLNPQTNHISLP